MIPTSLCTKSTNALGLNPLRVSARLVSAGANLWPSEVHLRLPKSWVSGSRQRAVNNTGLFSDRASTLFCLGFSDLQLLCRLCVVVLRVLGWSEFSVATGRTTVGVFTVGEFSGHRSFAFFLLLFLLIKCRLAVWEGWLSLPAPVVGSVVGSFFFRLFWFCQVVFSGGWESFSS